MQNKAIPQISIIVPIYNSGKFLRDCIDNVLRQSFNNWELLLINDGSTDSSGLICEEYAVKDKRIRIIRKTNTGVSDTRNKGLDVAYGKYIIFLDADDYWCDNDALRKLVETAEKYNLDIVRGEYKNVDIHGKDMQESPYVQDRAPYILKQLGSFVFLSNIVVGEYFLVLCLIRRSAISNLRFNTQRVFLEDAEFFLKMLQQPLKCIYIRICFYAYRKHDKSITEKVHPQKFFDALDYTRQCFNLARQECNTPEFTLFLINEGINNYLFDIKAVSETNRTNKGYNEVIHKYDLYNRRAEVISHAHKYSIPAKLFFCFLPLKVLIYYYRILFDLKRQLRHIYHKILRK